MSAAAEAKFDTDLNELNAKLSFKDEQIIGTISGGKPIYHNPKYHSNNNTKIDDVSSAGAKVVFDRPLVDIQNKTSAYEDKFGKDGHGTYSVGDGNIGESVGDDKKDLSEENNISDDDPDEHLSEEYNISDDDLDED